MHDIILILKSEMVHYIFENLNIFADTLSRNDCSAHRGPLAGTSIRDNRKTIVFLIETSVCFFYSGFVISGSKFATTSYISIDYASRMAVSVKFSGSGFVDHPDHVVPFPHKHDPGHIVLNIIWIASYITLWGREPEITLGD